MTEITGGCLCGALRYATRAPLKNARMCHCSRCRKVFSGPGSAYAETEHGWFAWTSSTDRLVRYETAPGWGLGFCGRCGSTLVGFQGDEVHGVTLGSVDGDPGVLLEQHIFVGSKASWDDIGGDAPRYEERPE